MQHGSGSGEKEGAGHPQESHHHNSLLKQGRQHLILLGRLSHNVYAAYCLALHGSLSLIS